MFTGDNVYVFSNNKKKGNGIKGKIIDWETRFVGLFSNDSRYWYLIKYNNGCVEWVNEKRLTKICKR